MEVKSQRCSVHTSDCIIHGYSYNCISPALRKVIQDIIAKEEYKTYKVNITHVPLDGGNYLSTLITADIKGTTNDETKEVNIFVKRVLDNFDKCDNILSIPELHTREIYAYDELFKIYKELQDEVDVPIEEQFNVPKYYDSSNSEFIILENLTKKGFSTHNRFQAVQKTFAKISVQKLAKFHALSFVTQKKRPQYFLNKMQSIKVPYDFNDEMQKIMYNFAQIATNNLEGIMKKKLEDFVPRVMTKMSASMCDDTNGEVTNICPVDYQFLHYGNPITDLLYFIFSGTDQQFRNEHLEDIKILYYETMTTFLRYFDMNIEDYFPRDTFETLFKERLDFGLVVAIWLLPLTFAAADDVPDFSKTSPADVQFKVDKALKFRLEGIICSHSSKSIMTSINSKTRKPREIKNDIK
ncbi:uncharacterized protein LOC131851517 [Achroia grisella]|uniref:uncharacterized protein LOC131851517 n=1 Tax=Achroia grisella TaxID=688607 RepID=UPI0027D328E9|nr:uncharacterized protein LOC131851517 [Achroia grisella]